MSHSVLIVPAEYLSIANRVGQSKGAFSGVSLCVLPPLREIFLGQREMRPKTF